MMDLRDFLTTVWNEGEGVACVTFNKDGRWEDSFFQYPSELDSIIGNIKDRDSSGSDCYFVPSLLRGNSRKKLSFKESAVAWVDVDGSPLSLVTPEPSIIIETSPDHYHCYWILEDKTASTSQLESTNKALAVASSSDLSGWDCTQLLRVPFTHSKKRDYPVTIKKLERLTYNMETLPKWDAPNLNLFLTRV